tara:strand:+ start:3225 stop:4052 length:828 start_codon:yes stop_codon:yes gene_type:complete
MTSVHDDFINKKNKELLWNVLLENGMFNGIDPKNRNKVQETFEMSIHNLSTKFKNSYDLISANKIILTDMVEKLKIFKNAIPELTDPITVSKPSENISEVTNNHFNEKQKEFSDLIELKVPKNVEFTNVEDEPIQEDQLDSILEETIKQRKLDLENIISKDKSKKNEKNKNDLISEKKQVKWAENIETNIDDIKEPPATNTNIDNNSDINILSKFKTKDSNRNSDIAVIEKIVILEKKISEISDVVKSIEKNINILMNNQLDNSNNKILSPTFEN